MERQLLITLLFILFVINGCQTQKISEPIALETKSKFVQEVEIPRNLPKNVWEYIILNSESKNEIILDEKTTFFLNSYLKNKKELNEISINLIILFTTLLRNLKLQIFQ